MTWVGLGTAAVGAGMSAYQASKSKGGQVMSGGVMTAPEDPFAKQARKQNYDYVSGMMEDIRAGRDPMQARRDQQLEHEVAGTRRDFFGTPGDRNQSIVGMGQQQMAMFGANPKQMLAQKRKSQQNLQLQLQDIRQRINNQGTQYMEKASFFAPEMMNKLNMGPKVAGAYGPQVIPGSGGGGGLDMEGISSMVGAGVGAFNKFNNRPNTSLGGQMSNWTKATGQTAVGGGASAWEPSAIPNNLTFGRVVK